MRWTLDRLAAHLGESKSLPIKRSRIGELLVAEGLCWRQHEAWSGERADPDFAQKQKSKKGRVENRYTAPPEASLVICLDEIGPQSAKSFAGQRPVHAPEPGKPAERARQEIDYGRRGSGYVFGAFCPATGEALTRPYGRRTIAHWVDFLGRVEGWLPAGVKIFSTLPT